MLALYRVYMPVKVVAPNKDIPAGYIGFKRGYYSENPTLHNRGGILHALI